MNREYLRLYVKKDKINNLQDYGFIKNDSNLFKDYIYINTCNTIQNRIFIHQDLHLSFGNINKLVLRTLYYMIKDNILEILGGDE